MEQLLLERIQILKEAGILGRSAEKAVFHTIQMLESDGVEISDENIGMFITHLIATIDRAEKKEAVEEVSAELEEELKKNPFYSQTQVYFAEIAKILGMDFVEAEKIYIGGYLCILLSQRKEGKR